MRRLPVGARERLGPVDVFGNTPVHDEPGTGGEANWNGEDDLQAQDLPSRRRAKHPFFPCPGGNV